MGPQNMDPLVQISLKYADLLEILRSPPLPHCKCISTCKDVKYKRSITVMGQTSIVFAWIIVPALELFPHRSSIMYIPPVNSPCTMHVHGYLGGRGSMVNCSIARIAGAVKLTKIVIYDRSAVQYSWIRSIYHFDVQISCSFWLNLLYRSAVLT